MSVAETGEGAGAGAVEPTAATVTTRLGELRRRMATAVGDPGAVTIVAVTKGFGPAAVQAALDCGLDDIGENYAAELLVKDHVIGPVGSGRVRWHYLGPLQRRKVRDLAPVVRCWQALARLSEGEAVSRAAPGASVLVEVNVAGVSGRPGVSWDEAPALVTGLRRLDLDVQGLMAVGPPGPPELARPAFRRLAVLAGELGLRDVSMGMSDDLEVALSEGATMVRIGRALFGPRPLPSG
jgi:uncharacterized pyridoxal phosphate-containing UPF0001 family protein